VQAVHTSKRKPQAHKTTGFIYTHTDAENKKQQLKTYKRSATESKQQST